MQRNCNSRMAKAKGRHCTDCDNTYLKDEFALYLAIAMAIATHGDVWPCAGNDS